jgi:hypothetical protein
MTTAAVAACTPSNTPSHSSRGPTEAARTPPPSSLDTRSLGSRGKPHDEAARPPPPSSLDPRHSRMRGKPMTGRLDHPHRLRTPEKPHDDEAARTPPPSSRNGHPPCQSTRQQHAHCCSQCRPPLLCAELNERGPEEEYQQWEPGTYPPPRNSPDPTNHPYPGCK